MTYLLDTHTFLWLLRAPDMLPARVRAIASDPTVTVVLSLATPWEMAIKTNLGKLDAAEILRDFERLVVSGGYSMLGTTPAQVIRGGLLPLHHRDPFDRLIAAQSIELGVPVVSVDPVFDLYGVKRIWN